MMRSDIPDNVKIIRQEVGRDLYIIPCEKCGCAIKKYQYSNTREYFCDNCKKSINKKYNAKLKALESMSDIRTEYEKRFDKALEYFDIEKYSKAIELAETKSEVYASISEVIMAILLLHNGIRVVPQQQIGRYRVDFLLPDLKKIIEVDGKPYHSDKRAELEREAYINSHIGFEWRIIHIDSEKVKDIKRMNTFICGVIRGQ